MIKNRLSRLLALFVAFVFMSSFMVACNTPEVVKADIESEIGSSGATKVTNSNVSSSSEVSSSEASSSETSSATSSATVSGNSSETPSATSSATVSSNSETKDKPAKHLLYPVYGKHTTITVGYEFTLPATYSYDEWVLISYTITPSASKAVVENINDIKLRFDAIGIYTVTSTFKSLLNGEPYTISTIIEAEEPFDIGDFFPEYADYFG